MTALLYLKKFRHTGNKAGAKSGWELLQKEGMGKILTVKCGRGTDKVFYTTLNTRPCLYIIIINIIQLYEFHKNKIPDDNEGKEEFARALFKFKTSLQQYRSAL